MINFIAIDCLINLKVAVVITGRECILGSIFETGKLLIGFSVIKFLVLTASNSVIGLPSIRYKGFNNSCGKMRTC